MMKELISKTVEKAADCCEDLIPSRKPKNSPFLTFITVLTAIIALVGTILTIKTLFMVKKLQEEDFDEFDDFDDLDDLLDEDEDFSFGEDESKKDE